MQDERSRKKQATGMAVALFLAYLAVALPLSILSVHITSVWNLSNFLGGLAVGSSFFTTIVFRKYTGGLADRMGGKPCFLWGAFFYAVASGLCVLSAWTRLPIPVCYALLLAGRLLLGVGESMVNTGMVNWYVAMAGLAKTGRVMALIGMSMYAAFAIGGPLGFAAYQNYGLSVLMFLAALLPAIAYMLVRNATPYQPETKARNESFARIIGRIWRPGLAICLQGVGFSVIGAFLSQTFLARGWALAGWGLSCFGFGFVLLRILTGHLPDRIGGMPVALWSFVMEAAGLYLLWLAPGPYHALAGSFLTGCGCSMIYPALGREVILTTPEELRGASIGCFAGFQDLAYGLAGPLAGFFADRFGMQAVFLFAALTATAGLGMTTTLFLEKRRAFPGRP